MAAADDLKQQEETLKRIQELYRKVYGEDIPIANLERLKKETKEAAQYAQLLEKAFNEVNEAPEPKKLVADNVFDTLFHVKFEDCNNALDPFPIDT